jgi:hypothetical protein
MTVDGQPMAGYLTQPTASERDPPQDAWAKTIAWFDKYLKG